MPVFEWDLDLQATEWDWREAADFCIDVSEDFWRKFEELPELGDDLESLLESAVCHNNNNNNNNNNDPSNVLRHHDCMWGGMCLHKEHKSVVAANNNDATANNVSYQQQPPALPAILSTVPLPSQKIQYQQMPMRQRQPAAATTFTMANVPKMKAVTGAGNNHLTVNHKILNNNNTNSNNNNIISPMEKPKREPRRKGVIVQKTVGRSLLINSRSRVTEVTRPETPPSLSESEEDDKKTVVSVVPVSEITNQVSVRSTMQLEQQQQMQKQENKQQTTNINVQFDHNYDKSVRLDDLGVQTPSDSEEEEEEEEEEDDDDEVDDDDEEEEEDEDEEQEMQNDRTIKEESEEEDSEEEEIDVVSLNNTSSIGNTVRMRNYQPNSLPYNPSRELRRELQDTVASAINTSKLFSASRSPASSRRMNNGPGRRKRKRNDSEDEDDERIIQQVQHQHLLNSRIQPTGVNMIDNSYSTLSSPAYHSNSPTTITTSSASRYHHPHHRRTYRRQTTTPTTTTTTVTSKKSKFSTDSETDCEKRSLHNNMERMRRIGLRNAFEDLRLLIPSLKDVKRAAKVNILKDSAAYVRQLTGQERNLAQKVTSLHHEQEKLRTRLSKLRRSLAAQR